MQMIRWGIVGLGTIAKKFADTVTAMGKDRAVLAAAASRDINKAKAFAEKYGIENSFGSYGELFESDCVDAVYICTPNSMHYKNCMAALENGKHVLCEKPFAINADEAKEIYGYAEEKNLFIMEALWTLHLPLLKKASELIKQGRIGKIVNIRADYCFTAEGARRERKFLAELGGGALLDVGIYNIGFVKMMYGCDPVSIKTDRILNEYGTDSFGSVLAQYPDNRFAVMTSAIGIKAPTEGVIYGTKGRIYFPDHQKAETLVITDNDGSTEEISMPFEISGFEYQIDECGKCIENGMTESPNYTHKQSIEVINTLDRIRKEWDMILTSESR